MTVQAMVCTTPKPSTTDRLKEIIDEAQYFGAHAKAMVRQLRAAMRETPLTVDDLYAQSVLVYHGIDWIEENVDSIVNDLDRALNLLKGGAI